MSLMLNAAVVARITTETLTSADQIAAQNLVKNLPVHYGAVDPSVAFPCLAFYEDTGTESMGGVDIGLIYNSIYRFQIWTQDRTGSYIPQIAGALERLFDMRQGAPIIDIIGDGKTFWSELFVPLQGPLHADTINAFFGMIAFRVVEARP